VCTGEIGDLRESARFCYSDRVGLRSLLLVRSKLTYWSTSEH